MLLAGAAQAQITGEIIAARTSGVAPLFVHFDAFTNTTATGFSTVGERFNKLTYKWDFDDSGSGIWDAWDGASKNEDWGPNAGHVFESSGTYTVSVTIWDGAGNSDTDTQIITVTDWGDSGETTRCISPTSGGNFTGCPECSSENGTTCVESDDWDASLTSALAAGYDRILYQGGESFTASSKVQLDYAGPIMIGSYGTGKATIAASSSITMMTTGQTGQSYHDYRIVDLIFDGAGGSCGSCSVMDETGDGGNMGQLLWLRVELKEMYNGFFNTGQREDSVSDPAIRNFQLAFVEVSCTDINSKCVFTGGDDSAMLGNYFNSWPNNRSLSNGSHSWRLKWADNWVIAHNDFWSGGLDAGTVRACAWNGGVDPTDNVCTGTYTQYMLLRSNNYHACQADRTSQSCQRITNFANGLTPAEGRLRNVIFEDNLLQGVSGDTVLLTALAISAVLDAEIRNVIFDLTYGDEGGSTTRRGIKIDDFNETPLPSNIHMSNLTCFEGTASHDSSCVGVYSGSGHILSNSLIWHSGSGSYVIKDGGGSVTLVTNVAATVDPFITAPPVAASNYQLSGTAETTDQGTHENKVPRDFGKRLRDDGSPDIGAWAYSILSESSEPTGVLAWQPFIMNQLRH